MIGIKGVGMASLALVYHRMGYKVLGSDVPKKFITDEILKKYGINFYEKFDAKHIVEQQGSIEKVVYSGAFSHINNPELAYVKEAHIPLQTHGAALGELMESFSKRISVCGSHGKTTTSAMVSTICAQSHLKGAHCIGVSRFADYDGGGYSGNEYFVAEADEYVNIPGIDNAPRFMFQHPHILVCTNVDFDHPDVYDSIDNVKNAFRTYIKRTLDEGGKVIYSEDDAITKAICRELQSDRLISVGLNMSADAVISNVTEGTKVAFTLTYNEQSLGEFTLAVPGIHNVYNAALAIIAAKFAGVDEEVIRTSLASYSGSKRRFELIEHIGTAYLYDDYAHHPREIVSTIEAARSKFSGYKIIVLFQPHTYSRTNAMPTEFLSALNQSDAHFLIKTFSSEREQIKGEISELGTFYTPEEVCKKLALEDTSKSVILTLGAGDIYEMHPQIITVLKKHNES